MSTLDFVALPAKSIVKVVYKQLGKGSKKSGGVMSPKTSSTAAKSGAISAEGFLGLRKL